MRLVGLLISIGLMAWLSVWVMQRSSDQHAGTNINTVTLRTGAYGLGTATIGTKVLAVRIPQTDELKQLGLGGQMALSDTEGMLWLYPAGTRPTFWMKGMIMSIDIIWIKDDRIVDVSSDLPLPPDGNNNLPTYSPTSDITAVLEVAAGFVERHNLKVGDQVVIKQAG